jgi:hypothetical protein
VILARRRRFELLAAALALASATVPTTLPRHAIAGEPGPLASIKLESVGFAAKVPARYVVVQRDHNDDAQGLAENVLMLSKQDGASGPALLGLAGGRFARDLDPDIACAMFEAAIKATFRKKAQREFEEVHREEAQLWGMPGVRLAMRASKGSDQSMRFVVWIASDGRRLALACVAGTKEDWRACWPSFKTMTDSFQIPE